MPFLLRWLRGTSFGGCRCPWHGTPLVGRSFSILQKVWITCSWLLLLLRWSCMTCSISSFNSLRYCTIVCTLGFLISHIIKCSWIPLHTLLRSYRAVKDCRAELMPMIIFKNLHLSSWCILSHVQILPSFMLLCHCFKFFPQNWCILLELDGD